MPTKTRARGRPRTDDRRTRNGMLSVLHTGGTWADLSTEDRSLSTCWRRWHTRSQGGTWVRIKRTLVSHLDADGKLEWARTFLDGSVVPANKGAMVEAKRRLATARK